MELNNFPSHDSDGTFPDAMDDFQSYVRRAMLQIEAVTRTKSVSSRRPVVQALRDLALRLEDPTDAVMRIVHTPLALVLAQIATNNGLFRYLSDSRVPVTPAEIRSRLGGDEDLHRRLCKGMAAWRLIDELGPDRFAASHVTRALTEPHHAAGVVQHFFLMNEILQALPDHLEQTSYKVAEDLTNTAFATAFDTDLPALEWLQEHPFEHDNWLRYMSQPENVSYDWTSVVPFAEYLNGWRAESSLFVDIGGGSGRECVRFRRGVAHLLPPGRVVVQDTAPTMNMTPKLDGIERMIVDFREPQPIRGARFYYLRRILNGNAEEICVKILRHTAAAMNMSSILLIDELVIADEKATIHATGSDLVQLSVFNGQERTRKQWYELIEKRCGLQIQAMRTYNSFLGDSIIECVLPSTAIFTR